MSEKVMRTERVANLVTLLTLVPLVAVGSVLYSEKVYLWQYLVLLLAVSGVTIVIMQACRWFLIPDRKSYASKGYISTSK